MSKHVTNGLTWRSGVDFGVNGIAGVGTRLGPVLQMLALATPPFGVQRSRHC